MDKMNNFNNVMYLREFKSDVFVPLIISVEMDYDYLTSNFIQS